MKPMSPRSMMVFLVSLCAALAGCGAEFQGGLDDEGESGSAGAMPHVAGSAGSAGAPHAGSGGLGGAGGASGSSAGLTGSGDEGGAAGSSAAPGASGASAGSAGSSGAPGLSCLPGEGTLVLPATFSLGDELDYAEGDRCASCPPGGCGTCTIESVTVTDTMIDVTARCDDRILAGACNEEPALCATSSTSGNTSRFIAFYDVASVSEDGYTILARRKGSTPEELGTTSAGHFVCGDFNYVVSDSFRDAFLKVIDHAVIRCDDA